MKVSNFFKFSYVFRAIAVSLSCLYEARPVRAEDIALLIKAASITFRIKEIVNFRFIKDSSCGRRVSASLDAKNFGTCPSRAENGAIAVYGARHLQFFLFKLFVTPWQSSHLKFKSRASFLNIVRTLRQKISVFTYHTLSF